MRASWVTRLALVEAALHPKERWQETQGLAALLAAARRLELRDPWTLPSVEPWDTDTPLTGMARLLHEARQWQREHNDDQV
jgi:hypothetical protein